MIKASFAALAVSVYLALTWAVADGRAELGGAMPQEPLRNWAAGYFAAAAGAILLARAMAWLIEAVGGRLTAFAWIAVHVAAQFVNFLHLIAGAAILINHDAPVLGWALVAAGLAGFIAVWPREDGAPDAADEAVAEDAPPPPPVMAAESRPDPVRSLREGLGTGMWTTVIIAAAQPFLFFGVRFYQALIDILVTGAITTPDEALQTLTFLNEQLLTALIFFPFIGFAVFLIMGLGRAAWETAMLIANSGAARDLPQTTLDDIETRAKAIEAYAREAPHIDTARYFLIDLALLIGGPFGAIFLLVFGAREAIDAAFAARLDSPDFRIIDLDQMHGPLLMMPGMMLLGFAAAYVVGRFWRVYGEHAGAQIYTNEAFGITLRGRLARLARSGVLNRVPRDPGLALRHLHTTVMRYLLWPGAIMTAMGAAAAAAALADVRIATPQGVEIASAWSQTRSLRPYAQADRLVLSCWVNNVGEAEPDGRLAFPDGALSLFENVEHMRERAAALEALDRALRAAGVPAEWKSGAHPFSMACVDAVTEGMAQTEAARIRTIFRIEDWPGRP